MVTLGVHAPTASDSWGLGIDSSGHAAGFTQKSSNPGSGFNTLGSSTIVTDGRWHHLVLTRGASTWAMTIDGAGVTLSNNTKDPGTPGAGFTMGAWSDGTRAFTGDVDEVALYTADITSSAAAHYLAGRPSSTDTNLTSRTVLDVLGRTVASSDPAGIATRATDDRLGRQTATIDNYVDGTAGGVTSDDDLKSTFASDALGELTGYCPAKQVYATGCDPTSGSNVQAWHYAYDAFGNLVTQTAPVNVTATSLAVMTWTYDAANRLTSAAQGARHTDYLYDAVGRPDTKKTYATAGTSQLRQTWNSSYNPDGSLSAVDWDGTPDGETTDTLVLTYDSQGRLDVVHNSTATLVDNTWNPDGTLASRIEGSAGTASFTYDWAGRLATASHSNQYTGSITSAWRLDGLLAAKTWPNSESAAFGYDSAKRPTSATYGSAGTLSQGYDRRGNVTAEARSLAGVTGDAGTNSQSFTYDGLDRLTGSSGLTASSSYTYDRDGNRVSRTDGAVTTSFTFDRTDELTAQSTNGGGSWTSFAFDAFGNTTTSVDKAGATTTSAYDAADRLRSLTPPAGSTAASFTFDGLGRIKTRVVGSNTDAYGYAGTSETVHQIVTTGSNPATLTSVIDPAGSRLTTSTGSLAYALPDLHGSTAALENAARTLTAAYRYDGYGQTIATYPSASPPANPFRYRGLLDLSSDATNPLYDMGARLYSPQLGSFTSLDSVRGSATDPASLNRFLYAEANPATLIDPDGHATYTGTLCGPYSDLCTVGGTLTTNPYSTTLDPASTSASSTTTYKSPTTASVSPPLPGGRDNWREDVAAGRWSSPSADEVTRMIVRAKLDQCQVDQRCMVGVVEDAANASQAGFTHLVLGGAGFIPVVGSATNAIDGLLYATEGEFGLAALSGAGAVPILGEGANAIKAARLICKGVEVAEDASRIAADAYRGVREASGLLQDLGVSRAARVRILGSFDIASLDVRQAGNADFGIRFFGDSAGTSSPALGRYLGPTFPGTDARALWALPRENPMSGIAQFQIRPGAPFLSGRVSPNFGQPGGGWQYFVPNLTDLFRLN